MYKYICIYIYTHIQDHCLYVIRAYMYTYVICNLCKIENLNFIVSECSLVSESVCIHVCM